MHLLRISPFFAFHSGTTTTTTIYLVTSSLYFLPNANADRSPCVLFNRENSDDKDSNSLSEVSDLFRHRSLSAHFRGTINLCLPMCWCFTAVKGKSNSRLINLGVAFSSTPMDPKNSTVYILLPWPPRKTYTNGMNVTPCMFYFILLRDRLITVIVE